MRGLSHIRTVLIGEEYRNFRRTLDVYLRFGIWIGQIQSKLLNRLVTNGLGESTFTYVKSFVSKCSLLTILTSNECWDSEL